MLWIFTQFWQSGINSQEQITQQIHLLSDIFEMGRIFVSLLLQLISNITPWTAMAEGHWVALR